MLLSIIYEPQAKPFSFDGRVTPSWIDYTPTLTNGDFVWGNVIFTQGFNVATDATVDIKLSEPVMGTIFLGEKSIMNVDLPLLVLDKITMAANSTINHKAKSIEVFAGSITATIRGYINNHAVYSQDAIIKTNGIDLRDNTLICHNITHNGTIWDFSNGSINLQKYANNGDYETENGIFFKGLTGTPLGVIYLRNAQFETLWENSSSVPVLRFYNLNRLNTNNVKFKILWSFTYTFSGVGSWFYPDETTFSGFNRTLNCQMPNINGSNIVFEKTNVLFPNYIGISAGPISYDTVNLTFSAGTVMLWDIFNIDGQVDISGLNKSPFNLSDAQYNINPGATLNFHDANILL